MKLGTCKTTWGHHPHRPHEQWVTGGADQRCVEWTPLPPYEWAVIRAKDNMLRYQASDEEDARSWLSYVDTKDEGGYYLARRPTGEWERA